LRGEKPVGPPSEAIGGRERASLHLLFERKVLSGKEW